MAHDLYIKNGKARMMYVGELPWHGLGTPLKEPATSAQAIKAAGLDWTVRKVPLYAIDGPGVVRAPNCYGIVPEDRWGRLDCPVFGVVSEDYRPLQNVEAFEFFDSIVGEKSAVYHTAGALGQGERIWILAKMPGNMEVTSSDILEKYVLLSTGHNGRTCVRVILTPVRVVCQNTLSLALRRGDEIARAHHTPDMRRQLVSARRAVLALTQGYKEMENAFRAMAGLTMTESTAKTYIEYVFPDPKQTINRKVPEWILADRTQCLHLFRNGLGNNGPGVRETLWAAYNGITEYVDHFRDHNRRGRMNSLFFGRGYQIKARAYDAAQRLVNTERNN